MQVVLSLSPGGTERLVIEIALGLGAHVDMRVCCLDQSGTWAAELIDAGVPVVSLARRPGFRPSLGWDLARLVRRHNVQVLHCHHYSPFVYGQLAALLQPGLRVVFTEHGRLSDAAPSTKRRIVNPWLGRLPFEIFAVSEHLRRHMIAEGLPATRIKIAYNGIDPGPAPTETERLRARHALGLAHGDLVIGTVGRLDPVKDLPTMMEAVALGQPPGASWRLVIVGDGPERSALESHARTLHLDNLVQFAGYRADVRTLLPAFDLYVNTSTHEGISLTILEAMAACRPIVASSAGGNPEVVVPEETGLLFPLRDFRSCAAAILALATDADRRAAMGRAGRRRVLERFSVDQMLDRYLRAYLGEVN
jgi:glycosyltransferase involved in cell wall biosynthesis